MLIFCRTKQRVHNLTEAINEQTKKNLKNSEQRKSKLSTTKIDQKGFSYHVAANLHSGMTLNQRQHIINQFRNNEVQVNLNTLSSREIYLFYYCGPFSLIFV